MNCGDSILGSGDLCADCAPAETPLTGTAVCPYCKTAAPWETVGRYRRTLEDGRVEVLYYCSACRGVIEAACWMER